MSPAEEKLRLFKNEVLKTKAGSLGKIINNTTNELFSEVAKQIEARVAINDTLLKKGSEGLKALISDIFNKSDEMLSSGWKKAALNCLINILTLFVKSFVWLPFLTINDAIRLLFSCMKVLNEVILLFPVVMIASVVLSLLLKVFARLTNFIFSKVGLISKNDFDYNKLLEEKLEEVEAFTRAKFVNEKSSELNNLLDNITKNIDSYNSSLNKEEEKNKISKLNGINTLKCIDLTKEQQLAIEMIMNNVIRTAEELEKKRNFEEKDKNRLSETNTAVSNINFIINLINTKVSKKETLGGDRELEDFQQNAKKIESIFSEKLKFVSENSENLEYKNKESKKKSIESAFSQFGIDLKGIDKYDEYGKKEEN